MEQRFRIKATLINGVTRLGDYMTPDVWGRHFWPEQRDRERRELNIPRLTLVPVDADGNELPNDKKAAAWTDYALAKHPRLGE